MPAPFGVEGGAIVLGRVAGFRGCSGHVPLATNVKESNSPVQVVLGLFDCEETKFAKFCMGCIGRFVFYVYSNILRLGKFKKNFY